ncbi:MAG TPA: hypothetical protein VKD70_11025 [Candidatus Acidoferrum sp.]|nr:hypothetical protein [Candidatus Acidoferrum sp.]
MPGSAYYVLENYREAARTITPLGDPAVHGTALGYAWAASLSRLGNSSMQLNFFLNTKKRIYPLTKFSS